MTALARLLADVGAFFLGRPPPGKPGPVKWLGQHFNPEGNAQRKVKAEIGARQYREMLKAARRELKENPSD